MLAVSGCDFHGEPLLIEPEFDDVSSFETDLGKWTGRAIDLGSPPATWEVARSGDRATQGSQSTRLRLGNLAGQTKTFVERRYEVEKSLLYRVEMSFDFSSADVAGVSPWGLLAGVSPDSPTKTGAVVTPGNTSNGRAADEGHVWLRRSFSLDVGSDGDGELFVYVGVGGMSEASRTYYLDNLKVTLTRKGLTPPR